MRFLKISLGVLLTCGLASCAGGGQSSKSRTGKTHVLSPRNSEKLLEINLPLLLRDKQPSCVVSIDNPKLHRCLYTFDVPRSVQEELKSIASRIEVAIFSGSITGNNYKSMRESVAGKRLLSHQFIQRLRIQVKMMSSGMVCAANDPKLAWTKNLKFDLFVDESEFNDNFEPDKPQYWISKDIEGPYDCDDDETVFASWDDNLTRLIMFIVGCPKSEMDTFGGRLTFFKMHA